MDTPKESNFTELIKVGNPYKNGSFSRFAYYTEIEFKIAGRHILLPMKVDTGAAYTVIGLDNKAVSEYKDMIMQSNMIGGAYDASGDPLLLKGFVVEDFKLTDDIVIPKIKIYFSNDIQDRALIGMDILSLFEHGYRFDKGTSNGKYLIYNYKQRLPQLKKRMLNKDIDYIDPERICSMDEEKEVHNTKKKYSMQDAEAAYMNKLSKQYMEEVKQRN